VQEKSAGPPPEPARAVRAGEETTETPYLPLCRLFRPCLEDLPRRLIDLLTECAGRHVLVPPHPKLLELGDEVEVAALVDPAALLHERLDTRDPIGDERDDALLRLDGKRAQHCPPPHGRLLTGEEQGLLEDSGVPADGTEQDEVQRVRHVPEDEPEPVDHRDELPVRDRGWWKPPEEEGESAGVAASEMLSTDPPQRRESAQAHPALEPAKGILQMYAQPFAAAAFLPNAPGSLAADALSAASAKMNNPCPTARGFRVYGVHTREV